MGLVIPEPDSLETRVVACSPFSLPSPNSGSICSAQVYTWHNLPRSSLHYRGKDYNGPGEHPARHTDRISERDLYSD